MTIERVWVAIGVVAFVVVGMPFVVHWWLLVLDWLWNRREERRVNRDIKKYNRTDG